MWLNNKIKYKRFKMYMRKCHRCEEIFRTPGKNSKICDKCNEGWIR